jgi:hypothetical protein
MGKLQTAHAHNAPHIGHYEKFEDSPDSKKLFEDILKLIESSRKVLRNFPSLENAVSFKELEKSTSEIELKLGKLSLE